MEKNELFPGIVVYDNVFLDGIKFIEELNFFEKSGILEWSKPYINDGQKDYVNSQIRDLDVISIPFDRNEPLSDNERIIKNIGTIIKNSLDPYLNDYKSNFGATEFNNYDSFQILRYGDGHHFANHVDDSVAFSRRISMSYYLSEDFEGGEIEFPRVGIKIKPKSNQLLIFPSNYLFNHLVHPVKNGVRYTIVNWIH